MSLNLLQPVGNVVESCFLSTVIDQDDTHCALVVSLRDCSEALLSRCVPNLKFNALVLHVDRLDFKVDT